MTPPTVGTSPTKAEIRALQDVEMAARSYARHSHGNIGNHERYRAREEARDALLDALSRLDMTRSRAA